MASVVTAHGGQCSASIQLTRLDPDIIVGIERATMVVGDLELVMWHVGIGDVLKHVDL